MIEAFAIIIALVAIVLSLVLIGRYQDIKKRAMGYLDDKLKAEDECLKIREGTKDRVNQLVAVRVKKIRESFESDNTDILIQGLVGSTFKDLQESIRVYAEQKYNRMTQEFLGAVSDDAEGLTRDLNFELCEKVWDSFQLYKEKVKDGLFVLPEGVKFIYTKGVRTIVVIEQKPQMRSLFFDKELLEGHAVFAESKGRVGNSYRYLLALPYVYFVVVFDSGNYKYHEVYFRNAPLTSMREHLFLAPLPNIHRDTDNKSRPVCMGLEFKEKIAAETTIARKCDAVISDFWQMTFNDDLGEGTSTDPRLKNYATWQKHSEENSLFVLDVKWTKGKTFKGVVELVLENRLRKHTLDPIDTEIRTLLAGAVTKISERIKEEAAEAKAKADIPFQQSNQIAATLLEETVVKHARKVFNKCVSEKP